MSGGEDRYIDPEEKERAKAMMDKLWSNYDADGSGELDAVECGSVLVKRLACRILLLHNSP